MDDELDLVRRAREESREAFAGIVRLHQAHVRAFFGRYLRNWDVVEDLAQETFLTAYQSLASFRGESPLRTWLLGIARNHALKYLRDDAARRPDKEPSLAAALVGWLSRRFEADGADSAVADREISALKECVKTLPEGSARLVDQHYFESRSAVEIARRTGRGESAVWMSLMRIRQALRRCMEARLSTAGGRS